MQTSILVSTVSENECRGVVRSQMYSGLVYHRKHFSAVSTETHVTTVHTSHFNEHDRCADDDRPVLSTFNRRTNLSLHHAVTTEITRAKQNVP